MHAAVLNNAELFSDGQEIEKLNLDQGPRGCQLFVPNSIFYGDPILICIEKWSFGHFCLKFEGKKGLPFPREAKSS